MTPLERVPSPGSPEEGAKNEENTPRMPGEDWTPEERAEFQRLLRRIRAGEMVPAEKEKPSTRARRLAAEEEFRQSGRTLVEELQEEQDRDEREWDRAA